tara:strand:+ start:1450 stop:2436 length:987 start_codon:yes stop_codon:yes gene_type:complete
MIDLSKPVDINWELNNICNLMCPQCARNEIKDGVLQWNKSGDGNPTESLNTSEMSLNQFVTCYNNIGNVGLVKFYGQISENVLSKDYLDICEFIVYSGSRVLTSTNGSIRTKKWWREFGKLKNNKVVFCIDGVDTLSHYRINASYDKIIENATSFIEGGGNAEWRMIVFKHNEHEISRAQETAKKLGFNSFTLLYSQRSDTTEFTYKGEEYKIEPSSHSKLNVSVGEIVCKFQEYNSIYVSHTGRVWPCCYLPEQKSSLGEQQFYDDYYYDKSNNLLDRSLKEIMEDIFYEALQLSWESPSNCLSQCTNMCSYKPGFEKSNSYRETIW